ncbi:hypothetical protein SteCoe_5248 [Stentor coeruleus]|uniref:non-specific serine/threonine protein kinase n=1 Tax=Stentor coeruleus TaxID=5963 RepID=A0A1R2CSQ3_9CILI|nr:hypothetical protein SteCoe_5248 [Stentor coeruleus]
MNLFERSKQISVFLNKDIAVSCETQIHSHMSLDDLLTECKEKLNVERHSKCLLYDSQGAELSDDDIEYLNEEEPLFLSQGESFTKGSTMALYNQVKSLGEGGFGSVSLYEHRFTHARVAIKSIKLRSLLSPEDINRVYSEIAVLRELKHTNIVQLYNTFTLNEEICFVMEYCSGGELSAYLKTFGPLPEAKVYSIALQIVDAIRYCHNSKIVHRDLKLENILFSSDSYSMIKIVDFGIAGMFNLGKSGEKSDAGSILYIPPEIYKFQDNRANPAIDIWAMGCIFYYLLTGEHPFMHETVKEIISHIEKVSYKPLSNTISKPWHRLIKGMLRQKPSNRWEIMRIQDHLEKYVDDPDSNVSDDSEEEENKKTMADAKIQKFNTYTKPINLLQVPSNHLIGKSHSPSRSSLSDKNPEGRKVFPKSPTAGKRVANLFDQKK